MNHEHENGWVVREREGSYGRERAQFIQRTYAHLAVAILAFVALEAALVYYFRDAGVAIFNMVFAKGPIGMLFVVLAFVGVSYLAQMWANSDTSPAMQYAGLALYVVVEAVIFLPIMLIVTLRPDGWGIVQQAGILTLAVFGGLTATVFVTNKDFSFLAPIISIGSMLAIGVLISAIIFGFSLGLFFAFAMVALLAACILFQTSAVIRDYRPTQYVAAALALFASIATLFYWILRILMMFQSRD